MTEPQIVESPLAAYRRYLDGGELAYQYSPTADRALFFPRVLCPFTGSDVLEWRVSAGRGTIHAITGIAPKGGAPYYVALIDVDEGFRMMSNVVPPAAGAPEIGMRVRVSIEPVGDDPAPQPLFRLESDHAQ